MARSRLSTALSGGLLQLPDAGQIALIRPPAGYDLATLPPNRLQVVHGFRPDADYWDAMGLPVRQKAGPAAMTIVVVPRSKKLARALVAEAVELGGTIVVDGQKTDGVDGLFREIRARTGELPSLTKAHGRLFSFDSSDIDLSDWRIEGPSRGASGYYTMPGVFSEDGVDAGSHLLAEALPAKLGARVADLGAGWGYLSSRILAREDVDVVDLVEAEALALDCARLNVTDPRAGFHWADVTRYEPAAAYDTVVTNPPFHSGRKAEAALGQGFIAAASRMLGPNGSLWLVANRHLPYEAALSDAFTSVEECGGDKAFKIFRAARPRRADARSRVRRR